MTTHRASLLLTTVLLAASTPQPGPARHKWEVGTVRGANSELTTTIYYGPWPCRRDVFLNCQARCATRYTFRGCIWLADVKFDGAGTIPFLGIQVKSGTRVAVTHCCCDYPKLKSTEAERKKWEGIRQSFRRDWAKRFGSWSSQDGESWPGHHIHDLAHGGQPTDPNNILPTPPGVHSFFNSAYPACYQGNAPWHSPGTDRPYTD
jgi:hypothetical protein